MNFGEQVVYSNETFYQKLVNVTYETGQGFPLMFGGKIKNFNQMIKELEDEGKVLCADGFVCVKGVYNVEADDYDGIRKYDYMRYYLGIHESSNIEEIMAEPEIAEAYAEWLETREEGLKKIKELSYVELND